MFRKPMIAVLLFFGFFSGMAFGQDGSSYGRTLVPFTGRFEVFPNAGAGALFRIDKFTGVVCYLVKKNDLEIWQKINKFQHSEEKTLVPTKINYQMFSAPDSKSTYLLNIHTGATWILTRDKNDQFVWQPLQ